MGVEPVIDAIGTSHELGYTTMYALGKNLDIGMDVTGMETSGLGAYNMDDV